MIKTLKMARLDNVVLSEDEKDIIKYYRLLKEDNFGKLKLDITSKTTFIEVSMKDKVRFK